MYRLKRVKVMSVAKIFAVLYFGIGLIFVPFMLLILSAAPSQSSLPFGVGAGFAIFMPFIYGIMGFIGGAIAAALYNLAARFAGGIEFDLEGTTGVVPQT